MPVLLREVAVGLPATVETDLLGGLNVLVTIRNGQTAEAAAAWLNYHQKFHGADAALILDRDPPDQAHFALELTAFNPDLKVMVVTTDRPLGQEDAPDARLPRTHGRPALDPDPWHAPLRDFAIFELLRHRFLSGARALAFLDIADLLIPDDDSVFDRAASLAGQVLPLHGTETYPWRLRQKRPAPHADHISVRAGERRKLLSWAAAPGHLPSDAIWKPGHPDGVPHDEIPPASFRRAMGVIFPGTPVDALVRKSDLREDPELLKLMERAFSTAPIRLPKPGVIAPRPVTQNVTVVTAMKNEGPFILDWIAHNRVIGIDRHLVYTNDCADDTETLLDLLESAGVTRRDNPCHASGKVPQHAAFRAAETETAVTEADWLLTLDVDEYINIHTGDGRIGDLLAAVPEAHVFSMPWRLFGNADRHRFVDAPVTGQFTRCAPMYAPRPIQAWAFKSLYRNAGLFRRLGVHRPRGLEARMQTQLHWVGGTGQKLPPSVWRSAWRFGAANWGYDLVSINHYAVRSAESFLVKRDRGRVNHTMRDQGEDYWGRMNHNAEEDLSIQHLATAVAAEKSALLAIPGVSEAHQRSVAWHQRRIGQLMTDPDQAALYATITSDRMQEYSRVATLHELAPTL